MRYEHTVQYTRRSHVGVFRVAVHTTLVVLTGGLWLIPLAVRKLLS